MERLFGLYGRSRWVLIAILVVIVFLVYYFFFRSPSSTQLCPSLPPCPPARECPTPMDFTPATPTPELPCPPIEPCPLCPEIAREPLLVVPEPELPRIDPADHSEPPLIIRPPTVPAAKRRNGYIVPNPNAQELDSSLHSTELLEAADEIAALFRRHAHAVSSHLNRERDLLLDDPDLPEDCREALSRTSKCNEHCEHAFRGQMAQDMFYYNNFVRNTDLLHSGFYVDVGAFRPKQISNTYFLDRCLGWKGICIEASPERWNQWEEAIADGTRSCTLVKLGIGKSVEPEPCSISNENWNARVREDGSSATRCVRLGTILRQENVTHVDFMTMDIEKSELAAVTTTNLQEFSVDLFVVETVHLPWEFDFEMSRQGYLRMAELEIDDVYVRGLPLKVVGSKHGEYRHRMNLRPRDLTWVKK